MASAGNVLGGAATGAAAGAPLGPWGMAGGALVGGALSLFGGDGDENAAPAPPPSQYGGNPLTDQLAAQQYAAGLQQQQAQNAREAAFYSNANNNFDIANAAQLRDGPQITSSIADKQNQLNALNGTNTAVGNVNQTGQQLTALGTKPMGASYAEAQLRQGQDAAQAQQLAMARSGRSLGSGQAAMQQAAFNNSALNQQTNQAAASARIQEQNAYNQFQAGALGAAGSQYGAAGALSGQAGGQATTIRQGNEGVQAQNAALGLQQQGVNNQTTGLYNQLGAQQQGYGMQANTLGQNSAQFGAQQASGALGAQLNADTGRLSSEAATNIANQGNANNRDAATMNQISSGLGAVSNALGDAVKSDQPAPAGLKAPVSTNPGVAPSGSSSGPANNTYDPRNGIPSDERLKTNIKALTAAAAPAMSSKSELSGSWGAPAPKGSGIKSDKAWADMTHEEQQAFANEQFGAAAASAKTVAPPVEQPASYAETIAALNAGYGASQKAPADVLNHVAGAGSGPAQSQSDVIARMRGQAPKPRLDPMLSLGGTNANLQNKDLVLSNVKSDAAYAPLSASSLTGLSKSGVLAKPVPGTIVAPRAASAPVAAPAAPPPAWGDVFNAPTLDPKIQAYLNGANPNPVAAPAPTYTPPKYAANNAGGDYFADNSYYYNHSGADAAMSLGKGPSNGGNNLSDVHSKTRIRELEGQLAALNGAPAARDGENFSPAVSPKAPDTDSLDSAYAREQNAPAVDLRPARGYSYEYKNPNTPGAAPGRQIGPMAQDVENTAAAATVHDTSHGKQIDTGRLALVNTAALSEQQTKVKRLEDQLAALSGSQPAAFNPGLYPSTRAPY